MRNFKMTRREGLIAGTASTTVIVDGQRMRFCLSLAVMHQGAKVTTIERLGMPVKLHSMQAAFARQLLAHVPGLLRA